MFPLLCMVAPLGFLKMLCLQKSDCGSLVQLISLLLHQSVYLLLAPPTAPAGAEGDQGVLCINFLVLVINVTFSSKFSMVPSVIAANKHSCYISNVMPPTQGCGSHLWVWLHWTGGCRDAVGDEQGHRRDVSWLTGYNTIEGDCNTKNYDYNTKTRMTALAALTLCLLEPLHKLQSGCHITCLTPPFLFWGVGQQNQKAPHEWNFPRMHQVV